MPLPWSVLAPTKPLVLPFSLGSISERGHPNFSTLGFPQCIITSLSVPNLSSDFKDLFLTSAVSPCPGWDLDESVALEAPPVPRGVRVVLIWEALLSGCPWDVMPGIPTLTTTAQLARSHPEQPRGKDLAPMGAAGGAKAFGRCQELAPATPPAIFQG